MSGAQTANKIRNDVDVSAGDEAQGDGLLIQNGLQVVDRLSDLWAGVVIEPRQDVRCAGHDRHAIVDRCACHGERHGDVCGAVIDAR